LRRLKPKHEADHLGDLLVFASIGGNTDIVRYLLSLGANPNCKVNGGSAAIDRCLSHLQLHASFRRGVTASHDLEDVIAVIDGRPAITEEIEAADARVRAFNSRNIAKLLADRRFMDALPGYLLPDAANQDRLGQLQSVLRALSLFEQEGTASNRLHNPNKL